ncbi:hypothetical protein AGABI2DRAFT_120800 [Agaricus bisporus var. bisporus H97]|uniref:hypothetical protein n=1 Tax=Agaricus bisporus var. bisporus (strain H97 / ATCC MYA-4626 / FGSC 10389) TaxID=936046 RepID=UPI00029F5C34|nr:hypothetical protein AGABI2DRAFT_120800 [Agaricus bisporus var. bisporus H97]EKV44675.1 hypothetical protein AGABI2DRAFT_120800 [Agaricus bisporus var. bisporus H97]
MSIAECPHCGYHLATELKEGLPALEAEVSRLEVLMSRLQEEKAIILRRFAHPPIDFAAYEPIFYDEDDPGPVSHRWRQVVLSTPQLWTTISLRVLNAFTNFNISLLDLYFKNAHSLPLSIQLDFSNCALVWSPGSAFRRYDILKALEPLEETIFDRKADRIYSLAFIKPPVEWFYFDPGNLSHCASMTIYWPNVMDDDDDYLLDVRDLPCLEHLKLVDSDVLFQLPTTVTTLQLFEIDMTHYIELLEELPKLVKLEITEVTTGTFEPVVLHRLEHLTWRKICVDDNHGTTSITSRMNATVFIGMLKALHAAGPRPNQFLLTTNSNVIWQPDDLRKVQALLSSGMGVKIVFAHGHSTVSVPPD